MLIAAVGIWLVTIDVRGFLERQASSRSSRDVHIGGFAIVWGNPIVLQLSDVRIGNAPWGKAPELLRFTHLTTEIEPWPLLHGSLRLRRIVLEQPQIALERDHNHVGNWKLHPDQPAGPESPRRAELPFIADLVLHNGEITFRTSSGALLHIRLDDVRLLAPTIDAPAILSAKGGYNDVPLQMDLRTQPFAVLWQTSVPFGFGLTAKAANTALTFQGTATAPLDFDGLKGDFAVQSGRFDDWMSIFGAPGEIPISLRLAGMLAKQGDHWGLPDARGEVAGSDFSGLLALDEGKSGTPDHFTFDLKFAPIDLKHLVSLASAGPPRPAGTKGAKLHVEEHPGETYDVRLGVRQARYGDLQLGELRLAAALAPAKLSISELSFRLAGGALRGSGSVEPAGTSGRAAFDAAITQADAAVFAAMLGGGAPLLSGRLDGSAKLEMTGETLSDGLRASRGQIVLGITQGRISRDLLERVSTNLSQLLRHGKGSATLVCFLSVANIRDGQASVAPLRLRTPEGNFFGGGAIDLVHSRINLQLKSEAKSTGFFALDLPVQITGSLTNPQAGLAPSFEPADIRAQAIRNIAQLVPATRRLIDNSPCLK